jgi:hypothetical protein
MQHILQRHHKICTHVRGNSRQQQANILAAEVLPVPRGPWKRYKEVILPLEIAPKRDLTTAFCPTNSSKNFGLNFLLKLLWVSFVVCFQLLFPRGVVLATSLDNNGLPSASEYGFESLSLGVFVQQQLIPHHFKSWNQQKQDLILGFTGFLITKTEPNRNWSVWISFDFKF